MTVDGINGCRRGKRDEVEKPVSKNQIQLGCEEWAG